MATVSYSTSSTSLRTSGLVHGEVKEIHNSTSLLLVMNPVSGCRMNTMQSQVEQTQPVKPKFDPDSGSPGRAGLDDRYKPNVDGFDVVKRREDPNDINPSSNRKTYAELRQQSHARDVPVPQAPTWGSRPSSQPDTRPYEGSMLSDDPPSKLRPIKKNKYGDEME